MKKLITTVSAALVATFAMSAVAVAADEPGTHQNYAVKVFSGSKPGKVAKKGPVGTFINPYHSDTWPLVSDKSSGSAQVSPPFAVAYADVHLDKNLKFNADPFPGCSLDKVLALDPSKKGAPSNCPKASFLGSGTAAGLVRVANAAPGAVVTTATLQDRLFASGKKNTVYLYTYSELSKNNVITGTVMKSSGKYGQKIRFVLPKGLINPAPGIISQLSTFDTTMPAQTYKGKALVTLKKCPSNKTLNSGYQNFFSDNGTPKPGVAPANGNDYVITSKSAVINRTAKCK